METPRDIQDRLKGDVIMSALARRSGFGKGYWAILVHRGDPLSTDHRIKLSGGLRELASELMQAAEMVTEPVRREIAP